MRTRRSRFVARAGAARVAVLLACIATAGPGDPSAQERSGTGDRAATDRVARLTPWGDPDLQGIWPSGSLTGVPFEREESLGTRATLTDEEVAARVAAQPATGGGAITPPPHWLEMAEPTSQSSLVVEPRDGRLPPLTPDGERRAREWRIQSEPTYPYEGPADLRPYDRCITRGVLGSAFPNIYGTGMEILQAPGLVVIRHEMIHETRVVPLDDRPHLPGVIRSYMGDPRGRWDGETLVVETTNFNGLTGSYARNGDGNPTSEALRLVERFRLTGPDTLRYEVRVEDPATFTGPWTVAFDLPREPDYELYEYACHEGNQAISHILSAARAAERDQP